MHIGRLLGEREYHPNTGPMVCRNDENIHCSRLICPSRTDDQENRIELPSLHPSSIQCLGNVELPPWSFDRRHHHQLGDLCQEIHGQLGDAEKSAKEDVFFFSFQPDHIVLHSAAAPAHLLEAVVSSKHNNVALSTGGGSLNDFCWIARG